MKRLALVLLLAVLFACVEGTHLNFHCEHSEAVAEDGSLLLLTDSTFDLTIDVDQESIASKRFPNFGIHQPKFDRAFVLWLAAPEGTDPYSVPLNAYRLSRFTGALHVSIEDGDKGPAVADGRCVATEPMF